MADWRQGKNILCIRADNMGDLIMSAPALRALKENSGAKITVLTSRMGSMIAPYIREIDEVIVADLPWIKTTDPVDQTTLFHLIDKLRSYAFDAAVIFTVYSQNPLPAALLTFMCGIPNRLAYCRENPYHLLTDWVPEKEPLDFIQHQVRRDLDLVATIDAVTANERLCLHINEEAVPAALQKLTASGISPDVEYIIFHPGVSEEKRKYPCYFWIELGKLVTEKLNKQILITGTSSEKQLAQKIQEGIGDNAWCIAGLLSMQEFIAVIKGAALVISVNTATVHIASATQTPVIVLYALTNPQHTPWKVLSKVYPFPVEERIKSRNEIINYVNEHVFNKKVDYPLPENILEGVIDMLNAKNTTRSEQEETGILVL